MSSYRNSQRGSTITNSLKFILCISNINGSVPQVLQLVLIYLLVLMGCLLTSTSSFHYHRDYDREQFADNQIPLLVIGTKLDQIPETKRNDVLTRIAFLAEDFSAEEINLVCTYTFLLL